MRRFQTGVAIQWARRRDGTYAVEARLPTGLVAENTYRPARGEGEAEVLAAIEAEVVRAFIAGELGPRSAG